MNDNRKDEFFDFKEERTIPGFTEHNLIKLTNKDSCLINFFLFFLATLLTLGEIYTIYLNSCSIKQSFKIRKIISTRYDLNQVKYDEFSPRLDLSLIFNKIFF